MEARRSASTKAFGASGLVEVAVGADAPPSFKGGCSPDFRAVWVSGMMSGWVLVLVQQTLGLLPRLCTGSRARSKHRPKPENKGSRDFEKQHAAQRDQDQARRSRYRHRDSLPRLAGKPSGARSLPEAGVRDAPAEACQGSRG